MKIFQQIATSLCALENCVRSGNAEWQVKHRRSIKDLVKNTAPSGSGIDCGTLIDLDASTEEKLVFTVQYHHMNGNGFYDGWTSHEILVRPSLRCGFTLHITGRDKNDTKDYLQEVYQDWLSQDVPELAQVAA